MHTLDNIEAIALNKQMNEQAQAILEKNGSETQASIICEELCELLTALFHYDRSKISKDDLISEIADVEMVLTQLKYIVCESPDEYTKVLAKKLAKQKRYIDNSIPWSNVNEKVTL